MRARVLASLVLATVPLVAVACGRDSGPHDEIVIRGAAPIQGGTLDTIDSAVVAILIDTPQGMSLCSGALIGPNLVLSAHHCVASSNSTACSTSSFGSLYPASSFMVTTSYSAAATIFNSGGALPAPDGVTWFGVGSLAVPGNDICGQDMSALFLSTPITKVCPLIPSVDTDVTTGETYTAAGFGITSPTGQTAGTRYDVTGMQVECAETCNDPTMSATQEWLGGSSQAKGTCEGDSGGPALDALGRVIGTVSRGPANACNQTVYESAFGGAAWIKQVAASAATKGGYAAAGWVTGGATSNPANGYCPPVGSDAGTTDGGSADSGASDTAAGDASSDGGGTTPTTCSQADGNTGCCVGNTLYYCSSSGTLIQQNCGSTAVCGWNASRAYYDCVAPPGGADPSGTYPLTCGGSPTTDAGTASDASDGGGTTDATADSTTDSGTATDSGAAIDSGTVIDSGTAIDSGTVIDSGIVDAVVSSDSGATTDAVTANDTGAGDDTGISTDASVGDDAASADSGLAPEPDSGAPAFDTGVAGDDASAPGVDATRGDDAGSSALASNGAGGCACTTAGSPTRAWWPSWTAFALGALALRRRRPRV